MSSAWTWNWKLWLPLQAWNWKFWSPQIRINGLAAFYQRPTRAIDNRIWVFSEMSFPRFDRLVLSDGGPLLIQYISDARVSSRHNDKQFFLYPRTNQRRLRGALLSWRYIGT